MVNNEMSEDMLGETGDGSGDCTETSASSSESQPKSESSPSAKEADEPASSADENVRLSPTSLFCSVPLNRDVQTIIDTFPKTEAEKAGKKTRKIPCLYCDRTFVADNLRQKHVERSHSIKQARRSSSRFQQSTATVACLFCNKFTLTENKLNDLFQHLVTAHPTKYFGCLPCQERFASLIQLEEHNDHTHGIRREIKVQSTEDVSDMKTNSAITDNSVVKTRHKAKIKDDSEQSDESRPVLRRGRQQVLQKDLKHKKIAIKSTKLGIKRSARLQTKVVPNKGKKRPKPKERVIEEPKSDKDKEVKVSSTENPYPTFDAFYRVKKITDHSIDNLRITSLTFNDVFDQAFYNRIKCNIRENLLNHLDGKLFKNEESESRISNFEKTQPEFPTSENYGCEISLNAATPVAASLLTAQFGDDPESQIEYGSKASKKKITPKQDEVHYKYFTRRKYQASILESKENRDLSKLDMWTQLVIKKRQQKILKETKSDREKLDYKKGEEYRAKKQNQELNRILDRRGPFEDLKEEASKKAALEGNFNQEAHSDVTFILDDILGSIFSKVIDDVEIKTELTDSEIPSYLNLRKASLSNDSYIDKSDKITLICASQETENFEAPDISPKDKNALVELTGEWARSRLYICAACGVKMANIKSLIDHKNLIHQNVWCQHYEFVGNQGKFYRHLSIPGLGKMEQIETNCTYKVWKRSEARVCTKCNKQCNSLGELHRHVLECGEDWSWMLVRKKCKYKPFGAKTRKKRRGLFKRIIHKDKPTNDENREKKTYKKEGPRVKPSDAETIQRMLANLPAKRATRKIMSLKDGFPKIGRKTNYKKKTPETLSKVVNIKSKKQNMQMRRNRAEILMQDTNTIMKGNRRRVKGMKCNPVNNLRKSMRNLNKVISSAIIDNNSTIMVKRKLKNAIQQQRMTRRSQQSMEPLLPEENFEVEEETEPEPKKTNTILKKVQSLKKPFTKKKAIEEPAELEPEDAAQEDEVLVRKTRSTSSLPDLEEASLPENIESPVKKKICKKSKFGKKLMRTLSLRRKKPETEKPLIEKESANETASVDAENTKNNGKRKSKLDTIKNAVKKIRLVKENLRSQKETTEVVGGHFLENGASSTAAETVTPVCELNNSDKSDDSENKLVVDSPSENETLDEVNTNSDHKPKEEDPVEKVICDNSVETEAVVSACEPVTENNEVAEDESVTVKQEKVSIPKTKLCKRNKGLNACIAMLTSKLQQKEVEIPNNLNRSAVENTTKPLETSAVTSNKTRTEVTLDSNTKVKEEIVEELNTESTDEGTNLTISVIPTTATPVEESHEETKITAEQEICQIVPRQSTETLETVDQNKPQLEVSIETHTEALVPEVSSETTKSFNTIGAPIEEKENIVLEQKPIEQNSPKKEEVRLEKVVDIIKCFEDINSKENINGHNKNGLPKTQKKTQKKIGGSKKKQAKTKLNIIGIQSCENVLPSVEDKLNTAILEEDGEIQRDSVGVRKLGQRRTLPKRNTKVKQVESVEAEKLVPMDLSEKPKVVDVIEKKVEPVVRKADDISIISKPESSKTVEVPVKPEQVVKKLIKEPKLILDSNFKIQTPIINFSEVKSIQVKETNLKTLIKPVFSFADAKISETQNFVIKDIFNFPEAKDGNLRPQNLIKPPIIKDVLNFPSTKLPDKEVTRIIKPPVLKDVFTFSEPKLSEIKSPLIIKPPVMKDIFSFTHETQALIKPPVIKNVLNLEMKLNEKTDIIKPLIKSPILKDVFSFPEPRVGDLMVAKLFNPLQKMNGLTDFNTNVFDSSKQRSKSFGVFDKADLPLNTSLPNLKTNLDEPDVLENKSCTEKTLIVAETKHSSDSEDEIPLAVLAKAKDVIQIPSVKAKVVQKETIGSEVLHIPVVKTKSIVKETKTNVVLQIPSIKSKSTKKHSEELKSSDSGVELTPKDQTLLSEKDIIQSFADFIKQNNVACPRNLFADTAEPLQDSSLTAGKIIQNSVTDLTTARIHLKEKKKYKKKGKLKKQLLDDLEENFMEHKPLLDATAKKKSKKKKSNGKLLPESPETALNESNDDPSIIEGAAEKINCNIRKEDNIDINIDGLAEVESVCTDKLQLSAKVMAEEFRKPEPIITKITIPKIHIIQKPENMEIIGAQKEVGDDSEKSKKYKKKDNTSPRHRRCKKMEPMIDYLNLEISLIDKVPKPHKKHKIKKTSQDTAISNEETQDSDVEETPKCPTPIPNSKGDGNIIKKKKDKLVNTPALVCKIKDTQIEENQNAIPQTADDIQLNNSSEETELLSNIEQIVEPEVTVSLKYGEPLTKLIIDKRKLINSNINFELPVKSRKSKSKKIEAEKNCTIHDLREYDTIQESIIPINTNPDIVSSITTNDLGQTSQEKIFSKSKREKNKKNNSEEDLEKLKQNIVVDPVPTTDFTLDNAEAPATFVKSKKKNKKSINAEANDDLQYLTTEETEPLKQLYLSATNLVNDEDNLPLNKIITKGRKQKSKKHNLEELGDVTDQHEEIKSDNQNSIIQEDKSDSQNIRKQKNKKINFNEEEVELQLCPEVSNGPTNDEIGCSPANIEEINNDTAMNFRGKKQKNKRINYPEEPQLETHLEHSDDYRNVNQNPSDIINKQETSSLGKPRGRKEKKKKINYNEEFEEFLLASAQSSLKNAKNEITADSMSTEATEINSISIELPRVRSLSRGRKQKKINYCEEHEDVLQAGTEENLNRDGKNKNIEENREDRESLELEKVQSSLTKGRKLKNKKINYNEESADFLQSEVQSNDEIIAHQSATESNNEESLAALQILSRSRKQKNKKINYNESDDFIKLHYEESTDNIPSPLSKSSRNKSKKISNEKLDDDFQGISNEDSLTKSNEIEDLDKFQVNPKKTKTKKSKTSIEEKSLKLLANNEDNFQKNNISQETIPSETTSKQQEGKNEFIFTEYDEISLEEVIPNEKPKDLKYNDTIIDLEDNQCGDNLQYSGINTSAFQFRGDMSATFESTQWKENKKTMLSDVFEENALSYTPPVFKNNSHLENRHKFDETTIMPKFTEDSVLVINSEDDAEDTKNSSSDGDNSDAEPLIRIIDKLAGTSNKTKQNIISDIVIPSNKEMSTVNITDYNDEDDLLQDAGSPLKIRNLEGEKPECGGSISSDPECTESSLKSTKSDNQENIIPSLVLINNFEETRSSIDIKSPDVEEISLSNEKVQDNLNKQISASTIFDFEDVVDEDFSSQAVHSSSKHEELEVITIASDDDEEEPIIVSDLSDSKNQEFSMISESISDNSKENIVSPKQDINSGKSKPIDTSTSSIDESEEAFDPEAHTPLRDYKNTEVPNDSSYIQTPDLNDTVLSNKINTKLKIKQPSKKKKSKTLKKKDRHSKSTEIYCDICDKKFVRSDSLIKHKRTLTHIAKLSEIEAREAEERAKKDQEGSEELKKSLLVPSPFSLKTNNDTLKLADIISDVLNKPVTDDNMDSFSEILDQKQETKRYKSLGERKSFDSDSIMFNTPKPTFTNHINTNLISNKLPHSTGTFLETQISLLENIIENKANFQYMDEISNKSDERCSSDMSLVSDIKQDDSNIISFSHNTSIVSSIIHSDTNFVKPTQYEEISEDTRNFDEQRARKALNRDEELFLECCSLLKSSSEVSDYSKKSAKTISMVSTYGLKPGEETGWLEHKNLITNQKPYPNNEEYLSDDNSRPQTPIGDNYDDFSNSNTIRTEWNSKMKEGEFEDISLDSLTNSENNSNFNNFGINFNEGHGNSGPSKEIHEEVKSRDVENDKFDDLMDDDCLEIIDDEDDEEDDNDLDAIEISEEIKSPTETSQVPIISYTVPLPKKSDSDSSTNDSKKVMTKGAMKVFEGLKVSIPTEELDMSEVLNCSPTTKRQDLEPTEANKEDKIEKVEKSKDNLNRFGNKLGLKITKKRVKPRVPQEGRKLEDENKVHDVYDFEETQDNTDLFIPNNLKTFRTQLAEKKEEIRVEDSVQEKEAESDLDSNNHYIDSFSVEAQSVSSFSTETESSLSMKKNTGVKNITKKKCVIMGRIFKNAFKAKTDEIKNIPVIENVKLVENYVMNCPEVAAGKPVSEERIKMTEQEMDQLFDKLLEENGGLGKDKAVETESTVQQLRKQEGPIGKGRSKAAKQKKRVRKQSQSSDDEFNLSKSPKKRTARKKVKDNGINLEQELKECMGVAGRKSQRKCTSGKQNVLVEDWSSDDSEFEAMLRQSIQQSKTTTKQNKEKVKETPIEPEEPPPPTITQEAIGAPDKPPEVEEVKETNIEETKTDQPISEEFLKEIVKNVNEAKPKPRRKSTAKKEKEDRLPKIKPGTIESTLASNRRKRAAVDTLYYWSSSSDDDSQNLIEIKSARDEIDEDDDRPMQHGWIVGDSPKKLVTMLAQAKGKKIDTKCVKEQSKKRTTI